MSETSGRYLVYLEEGRRPRMYGIRSRDGVKVGHISTDLGEVNRLAASCNRGRLSPVHLADVVEDFRRG